MATYTPNSGTKHISGRTHINIDYGYDALGNSACFNIKLDTIVIILESPHTDEYVYVNGILAPKGPLVGSWGNFEQYFHAAIQGSALNSYISNTKVYNIAFVNAIQYQCSLGKTLYKNSVNTDRKNQNVINSWYSGFSVDLEKRLMALNPIFLVDLSGKTQEIHSAIINMLKKSTLSSIPFTYGIHPSKWKQYSKLGNKLIQ